MMNHYVFADKTVIKQEGGIPHKELMELIKKHGKCINIIPESMYTNKGNVA